MQQLFKDVVVLTWRAAWDRGEVDALDEILAPDYRRVSSRSHQVTDAATLKQDILATRHSFPDLVTHIDSVVVDADGRHAALFWRSTGTFTHDLQGVPATGRRVETRGSNQLELRDGKIVSEHVTWDHSELLADLGVPALRSAFIDAHSDTPSDTALDHHAASPAASEPDADTIKAFNRQFVTGVTVVTTLGADGKPRGLAANSYASVSVEPPLVLICVQKTTQTYASLFASTHLGINIMSHAQLNTVGVFAGKGDDKFATLDWHAAPHGSPLLDGSAASIEAEIKERFQAKTHTVFIARVTHAEIAQIEPMLYKAGKFFDGAKLTEL